MSLSASIKSIQDIMRKDVGVDGDAQRLSQLAWMLFLKIFDAQETELEMTRDDYRSPFPQKLRWRNWAADAEGITGDGLMKFINDVITQIHPIPAFVTLWRGKSARQERQLA